MTSSKMRAAFELSKEDPRRLDRYGRTLFGQSTLIARKLLDEGVRFVNVTWDLFWDRIQVDYDAWDTHTNNFAILKTNKLPHFDQTFSALIEDLDNSGLLDETLVVGSHANQPHPKDSADGIVAPTARLLQPVRSIGRRPAVLDPRSARRLALLFVGAILARGRRTVTSWIRAAGLSDEYRPCYTQCHIIWDSAFRLRSGNFRLLGMTSRG